MTAALPRTALQLRSLVKASGELELSLTSIPTPEPGPDEVVIRIEAAPLNPSDLGLLFGAADMRTAVLSGTAEHSVVTARASDAAQALLGRRVAALGGAMYSQYRCVPLAQCLALPEGATAADGASCFVNPLTALGMVETMRREGHHALVHTAAASNLGQMLNRTCLKDGVALVNIVRKPAQVALLREIGAEHVCDASAPSFLDDLTQALVATGATLAFDATGGGKLAGQILGAMEAALNRTATEYSRYGSATHKQVYLYGGLDTGPTEFVRNFGMSWGMGGWLMFPFLQKIGPAATEVLKQRVAAELHTTFKSHYAGELSLAEVLQPDRIAAYGQRATGAKFLINPSR